MSAQLQLVVAKVGVPATAMVAAEAAGAKVVVALLVVAEAAGSRFLGSIWRSVHC